MFNVEIRPGDGGVERIGVLDSLLRKTNNVLIKLPYENHPRSPRCTRDDWKRFCGARVEPLKGKTPRDESAQEALSNCQRSAYESELSSVWGIAALPWKVQFYGTKRSCRKKSRSQCLQAHGTKKEELKVKHYGKRIHVHGKNSRGTAGIVARRVCQLRRRARSMRGLDKPRLPKSRKHSKPTRVSNPALVKLFHARPRFVIIPKWLD